MLKQAKETLDDDYGVYITYSLGGSLFYLRRLVGKKTCEHLRKRDREIKRETDLERALQCIQSCFADGTQGVGLET